MSFSPPFAGNTQRRTTECRLHQVPRTVRLLSSVSSSCPSDTSSARRLSAIYLKSQWHVTGESSWKFFLRRTKASRQIPDSRKNFSPTQSVHDLWELCAETWKRLLIYYAIQLWQVSLAPSQNTIVEYTWKFRLTPEHGTHRLNANRQPENC